MWGVHCTRSSRRRRGRAPRRLACLLHFRSGPADRACFLGNKKGTHHETCEDSGCVRAARCSRSGERTSVIHRDSHERLRLPRLHVSRRRIRHFRRASTTPMSPDGTSAHGPATSTSATWTSTTKWTSTPASPAEPRVARAGTSASSTTRIRTSRTPTTIEAYGSISYDWFKGKLWYSNDFGGDLTYGDTSAIYLEANATIPLPAELLGPCARRLQHRRLLGRLSTATTHRLLGRRRLHESATSTLALKWVDTETDVVVKGDVFNNEGRVIFTVATTFPWSNE